MRIVSLFSGIGGFELAGRWMGWEPIVSCEINPFGQRVLRHHFPEAYHHDDIHTLTKQLLDEKRIDTDTNDIVLTGGFPCQPYSAAGKRLGKEDERHLWPEMLRVICEISPRWVVGENVRGLTNWNGGVVFDEVQADLEAAGYEVLPFLLPACAVNAPHRRDRIWFVAYAEGKPSERVRPKQPESCEQEQGELGRKGGWMGSIGNVTHAEGIENIRNGQGGFHALASGVNEQGPTPHANSHQRPEGRLHQNEHGTPKRHAGKLDARATGGAWENFPTQPPICGGNDGVSSGLDGITFSKWRNESIKAYGNAIVPQVAFQIFKAIQEYENLNQ
jgi:DNA (cytosine-5)-methyltransferase 1